MAEVIAQIAAAVLTLAALAVAIHIARREHRTAAAALRVAEREQNLRLTAMLAIEGRLIQGYHFRKAAGEYPEAPWELAVTNHGPHEAREVALSLADDEHWPDGQVIGSYGSIDGEGQSPFIDFMAPGQSAVMSRGQLIGDDAHAYVRLAWSDGRGAHSELRRVPLDH